MAIRNVRIVGDEILRKKSREVLEINDRLIELLDDMNETMRKEDGIGLAAPQVGILKRVVVVDVGQGPIYMINPEIVSMEGSAIDEEGCLSVPGENGKVERPSKIIVNYMDKEGNRTTLEAEELLARCICHEIDHLDGVLFIDKILEE